MRPGPEDPAARSLADALRVSFRLLTIIMIFMVVAFVFTGVTRIKDNETGIIKVFGRIVGTADAGLAYNWPFPVGEIVVVATAEQTMKINDLWMNETPADAGRRLIDRRVSGKSLRPVWDGALLTGDRYLVHAKFTCKYKVHDAETFLNNVPRSYRAADRSGGALREVIPKEQFIRTALCSAAIRIAAVHTAEALKGSYRDRFGKDVMDKANEALAAMATGLRITSFTLSDNSPTWPLATLRSYEAAQRATSEAERLKSEARGRAEGILRNCAGSYYEDLVGRLWQGGGKAEIKKGRHYNLIGQYVKAAGQGRKDEAEKILATIDDVLANHAEGDVSGLIHPAQGYRTRITEDVQARANNFRQLLSEYRRSPEFFIARYWAAAREEILSSPDTEKFYITPGKEPMVLLIGRDPEIVRAKIRQKLEARAKQPDAR